MTAQTPGSERLPSTLAGPGWHARVASHGAEVAEGRLWTRCGYRSEYARLRRVLLVRPPCSLSVDAEPNSRLMLEKVDLSALRDQCEAIIAAFRRLAVDVLVGMVPDECPPNVVFQRDLFLMTPDGAVLGRPASRQRAGEERHTAAVLASAGYPILRTLTGRATFEGADALWADPELVLVGTGFRTNTAGARKVGGALRGCGARTERIPLGPGVQHLLGTVVFLDHRLAAVHAAAATPPLRAVLHGLGFRLLDFDPTEELVLRRGLNLVVVEPGLVLMPSGAPGIRRALGAAGVQAEEVEMGDYVKAAGGLGCVTGILHRS
ncbi:N-dimethylarginine dimethylaminohydrolase [Frankia casuarinae]|uniref:Amidinotransferase n=2 Tax=Frankia casuarinae (strain DSM 45818 / CECT 9043 / HFP020203 / CcI3) TaxID=106370 RepID=Q2JC57_FRACC|nr:amidinotransferase [Frankia casuarinae]EYT90905.1 N-dimethylarginine dimethylaminohydrolase [Frankia casuarinae]